VPSRIRSSISKCRVLNLRIVNVTPARLHGGITAATRLPSGSRESRMGFDSEMSSPQTPGDILGGNIVDVAYGHVAGNKVAGRDENGRDAKALQENCGSQYHGRGGRRPDVVARSHIFLSPGRKLPQLTLTNSARENIRKNTETLTCRVEGLHEASAHEGLFGENPIA
jgi:hypothetical protein